MSANPMTMPRAPEGITPAAYFEEWLPEQLEKAGPIIKALIGDMTIGIGARVGGPGGGDWTVRLENGTPSVKKALDPDNLIVFSLGEKDFTDAVTQRRADIFQQPPVPREGADPERIKKRVRDNLELLSESKGSIGYKVEDKDEPFEALVVLGSEVPEAPDVEIALDLDTARSLASGKTTPQGAFMEGKVKIRGDIGVLMRLMPIFS